MKKVSSLIVIIVSIVTLTSLKFPLWNIDLEAPQYPEGLHMEIWLDHLSGDVQTISVLNHYIGMKAIEDNMFPEFGYMKQVILCFIISGIIVAVIRKKWLYNIWFVMYLGVAAYGIYDFWQWEYDYGHHLNPHAAIIIPGMSYQPPLIGCRQLLNFNACSFPTTGGLIIMSGGTICFLVFLYELFFNKEKVAGKENTTSKLSFAKA
jgi:copper chaperone NosL